MYRASPGMFKLLAIVRNQVLGLIDRLVVQAKAVVRPVQPGHTTHQRVPVVVGLAELRDPFCLLTDIQSRQSCRTKYLADDRVRGSQCQGQGSRRSNAVNSSTRSDSAIGRAGARGVIQPRDAGSTLRDCATSAFTTAPQ